MHTTIVININKPNKPFVTRKIRLSYNNILCFIVLAFSDLYIEWKDFKNNMTAVVSSRTIITEDPISNEANDLKNYADRYLVGLSNKLNINIPNCNFSNILSLHKTIII